MNTVYVKGSEIYEAAVAGAKRKYNRSTDNYVAYEEALSEHYKKLLVDIDDRRARRSVERKTKGSWKQAYLPLSLAMVHKHIGGEQSEPHARVYLSTLAHVFDIPLEYWEKFEVSTKELLEGMESTH